MKSISLKIPIDTKESFNLIYLWIALLAGLTIFTLYFALANPQHIIGYDFQAFWCGGQTLAHHANPYLNQPLHGCESKNSPGFFVENANATIPAPLPPYALTFFIPWSFIPWVVARAIWWIFLVACIFIESHLIQKLTGKSFWFSFFACSLALTAPTMLQGALAPLPIMLVTAASWMFQTRRWAYGSILLALSMIEPHLALPACIAVFVFLPKTRLWLITVGFIEFLLAIAAVGLKGFFDYFQHVLPVHAKAELNNVGQESLTIIVHHLGISGSTSMHLGAIQYIIFCFIGIFVGYKLSKRYETNAWFVLAPASFAVVGGEFIHLSEMAILIPASCLLSVRYPNVFLGILLAFFAIPGEALINSGLYLAPGALILALYLDHLKVRGIFIVLSSLALIVFGLAAHPVALAQISNIGGYIPDPGPNALSSIPWGMYNDLSVIGPIWWLEKFLSIVPALAFVYLLFHVSVYKPAHTQQLI